MKISRNMDPWKIQNWVTMLRSRAQGAAIVTIVNSLYHGRKSTPAVVYT